MSIRCEGLRTLATATQGLRVHRMPAPTVSGIEALARALAGELTGGSDPAVRGDAAAVAAVVSRVVAANFTEEAAIEREAEKALATLPTQPGMDEGKLFAGLRERLAKKRGFVL